MFKNMSSLRTVDLFYSVTVIHQPQFPCPNLLTLSLKHELLSFLVSITFKIKDLFSFFVSSKSSIFPFLNEDTCYITPDTFFTCSNLLTQISLALFCSEMLEVIRLLHLRNL